MTKFEDSTAITGTMNEVVLEGEYFSCLGVVFDDAFDSLFEI